MKNISLLIISFIGLIMILSQTVQAQTAFRQYRKAQGNKGNGLDLRGNLHILNLCKEQTEEINELYTKAFTHFSANPSTTFADLTDDLEFVKLCEKNSLILTGGPMLGNVSPNSLDIWVRTLYPSYVEIYVFNEEMSQTFGPEYSTAASDLVAVVKVSGLEPATKYQYKVLVNGNQIINNEYTRFTTSPDNAAPAKTKIAFGTCSHRWGLCNQELADQIMARNPMALLLGGDIAVQDRNNNIALHRADYFLRDLHDAWKGIAASLPVYATWDDHDYFDNDLYNIPDGCTKKDKEAVCSIFRSSWNNPPYGIAGKDGGVFFRTRIGPADVIMLDNRYFREKGNFLGDKQMQWLEEQLLDCKGPFIILSCGTMWSDYVQEGKDSWGKFDPEGREKIFTLIEKNQIGGVLLISGDRHGTRGFSIPRPSGFSFYEFEVGSLGGRVGPSPIQPDWNTQLFGLRSEYAFGEFLFDTTIPDPEVTFRLISERRGTVFYELTLSKSQLTP